MKKTAIEKDPQFLNQTITSLVDQIDLFETFQDLSLKIISQFDLNGILDTFSHMLEEIMPYSYLASYIFQENDTGYRQVHASGHQPDDFDKLMPGDKMIQWVMHQGWWTILTDPQGKASDHVLSVLPLRTPAQRLGFIIMINEGGASAYNRKSSSIINFLISQTAIAIENQRLYAQVKASNNYMTNLLESISNGIIATDIQGRVSLINKNATAMLGIKSQKLVGLPYQKFLKGPVREQMEKLAQSILNQGYAMETMVTCSPYKEVKIMIGIIASPLVDPEGKTIGMIYIFRNMSASIEIARLTKLDQMKSEFVSNVSHELRTPLSIIKSYSEALLNQVGKADHETRERFLNVIDSETDRLSGIVSSLLDLSRIESGKFELDLRETALEQIIMSILIMMKPRTPNINFFTDFAADLPKVNADEDKLKEVILNLLSNAVKFSPTGGTVHIAVEKQKDRLVCAISDTGIGIPEDALQLIFKKFYRVDSSDTSEIEGTGLGLSIVKHILTAHGGDISVESELGKGSVFSFFLPLYRGDSEI